jgi:hypothetical protein
MLGAFDWYKPGQMMPAKITVRKIELMMNERIFKQFEKKIQRHNC